MAAPTAPAGSEGLSLQTLVVASLASAGAALITSLFWKQGTIMAAALTPVLVALLREALHRPAARLSSAQTGRRPAAAGVGAGSAAGVTGAGAVGGAGSGAAGGRPGPEGAETPTATRSLGTSETERLHTRPTPAEPETRVVEGETEPLPSPAPGAEEATHRLDPEALTEGPPPPLPTRVSQPTGEQTELVRDRPGPGPGAAGAGLAGAAAAGAAGGAAGGAAARGPGRLPPDRGAPPHGPDRAATPAGYSRYRAARSRAARGLTPRRVRIALVTGLLAFLIAALVITVPELITGESIGGGGGGTTLFPSERASDSGTSGGIEDSPIDEDQGEPSGGEAGGGTAPDSGGSSDSGGSGGSQPDQGSNSREPPASQSPSGSSARKPSAAPSPPSGGGGRP